MFSLLSLKVLDPVSSWVNNFDDSFTAASTFGFSWPLSCSEKKNLETLDKHGLNDTRNTFIRFHTFL
jgi:hypothetical protein